MATVGIPGEQVFIAAPKTDVSDKYLESVSQNDKGNIIPAELAKAEFHESMTSGFIKCTCSVQDVATRNPVDCVFEIMVEFIFGSVISCTSCSINRGPVKFVMTSLDEIGS